MSLVPGPGVAARIDFRRASADLIGKATMKMKRLAIITILIFRTVAYSENLGNNFAAPPSWIPRPMVLMGPSLMGSGYQNMALNGGATAA